MRIRLIALVAVTGLLLVLAPGTAQAAKARYRVTVKVSTTAPVIGQTLTVSGKVTGPKAKGKKVAIQAKYPGAGYKTIGHAKITAKGAYKAKVKPTRAGATTIRVVKAASSARRVGTKSVKVVSWKWLDLTKQKKFVSSTEPTVGTVNVAGKTYGPAFTFSSNGAYFKVGNACSTFTASVGVTADATTPGVFAAYGIAADETIFRMTQLQMTQTVAPVTETESLARIHILAVGSGSPSPVAVIKPRVLCTVDALPTITSADLPVA